MEANCFTILWWFLTYIYMNQPWVYMCSPSCNATLLSHLYEMFAFLLFFVKFLLLLSEFKVCVSLAYKKKKIRLIQTLNSGRGKWQPTPVFLTGKFHGQKSLAGYSPWGCKESDMIEHTHCQLSCLLSQFKKEEWKGIKEKYVKCESKLTQS